MYNVAFLDFLREQSLLQCVHEPTRADNILELVLTDDPFAIFDLHVRVATFQYKRSQ